MNGLKLMKGRRLSPKSSKSYRVSHGGWVFYAFRPILQSSVSISERGVWGKARSEAGEHMNPNRLS